MIVSHRHKFIYLKTEKTASTSMESVLTDHCGPEDIISGARRDPVTRKPKARNNHLGIGRLVSVPASIKHRFPSIAGYYPHMPARQVKALVGDRVWNSYFKFTTERNPWDRQVSNYFHRQSRRDTKADFEHYLTSPIYHRLHHVRLDNWGIYTIDGEIVVDAVIRYENLASDTLTVMQQLGIASDIEIPFARAGHRPSNADYRKYYTDRTIEVVERWYAREISAFGYSF